MPALIAALRHSYSEHRRISAEALGRMGPAVLALEEALLDPCEYIREAAAQVVGIIRKPA